MPAMLRENWNFHSLRETITGIFQGEADAVAFETSMDSIEGREYFLETIRRRKATL